MGLIHLLLLRSYRHGVAYLLRPALGRDGMLKGQVLGEGATIARSTLTLWAASSSEPKQLAQTKADADGCFALSAARDAGFLYCPPQSTKK